MTYAEMFAQFQKISEKQQPGQVMSDEALDEIIELASQLPCTGEGPDKPIFRKDHVAIDIRTLDSGEKLPPGFGCMHCTWLAAFRFIKSVREAERNSMPLPAIP